jgi:hypothetical protein
MRRHFTVTRVKHPEKGNSLRSPLRSVLVDTANSIHVFGWVRLREMADANEDSFRKGESSVAQSSLAVLRQSYSEPMRIASVSKTEGLVVHNCIFLVG